MTLKRLPYGERFKHGPFHADIFSTASLYLQSLYVDRISFG